MNKCASCRYSCRDGSKDCKFYPIEELLGKCEMHFRDSNPHNTHDKNSRMCVVCKGYFNHKKIRYTKQKDGLYPMCLECAKIDDFCRLSVG